MDEILGKLTPDTLARIVSDILEDDDNLDTEAQIIFKGFVQQGINLIGADFKELVVQHS